MLLGREQNTICISKMYVLSYNTKYNLGIWSRYGTSWYLPKGVERLYPHKNLHMDVLVASLIIVKTWKQPRYALQYLDG
jgi:hypothetical protein